MKEESTRDYPASKLIADKHIAIVDRIAIEQPVVISLDGTELVTLLCTPTDLDALAVGYLASERYIVEVGDVNRIEVDENGSSVLVATRSQRGRALETAGAAVITSGCGGGRTSRDLAGLASAWRIGDGVTVSARDIRSWMKEFAVRSTVFHETGGVHSAAVHVGTRTAAFSEDVGRHNAVDKVLGRAMLDGVPTARAVVLTSGRISSEVVVKCAVQRVSIVVSRAAATSLALELAEQVGLTVVGFTRGRRMTVYTHHGRVRSGT